MKRLNTRLHELEAESIDFKESIPNRPLTDAEFEQLKKHVSLFDILTDCTYPDDHVPEPINQKFLTECERRGINLFV